MPRSNQHIQALIVLVVIAALCLLMSRVLIVPGDCPPDSTSAACLHNFPPYPPNSGNTAGGRGFLAEGVSALAAG